MFGPSPEIEAMENARIRARKVSFERNLELFEEMLDYARELGFRHRDLHDLEHKFRWARALQALQKRDRRAGKGT